MEACGQLHAPAALPPRKDPLETIGLEAGWTPETVWTRWWRKKIPSPCWDLNPLIIQPVVQRYSETGHSFIVFQRCRIAGVHHLALRCYHVPRAAEEHFFPVLTYANTYYCLLFLRRKTNLSIVCLRIHTTHAPSEYRTRSAFSLGRLDPQVRQLCLFIVQTCGMLPHQKIPLCPSPLLTP